MNQILSSLITLAYVIEVCIGGYGDSQYWVYTDRRRNGNEAKALCQELGTTLATVITAQDLTSLRNAVDSAGIGGQSTWIGLRDEAEEGMNIDI